MQLYRPTRHYETVVVCLDLCQWSSRYCAMASKFLSNIFRGSAQAHPKQALHDTSIIGVYMHLI